MEGKSDSVFRIACAMVIAALTLTFLSIGAGILLPLVEALILWFIINRLARAIRKLPGIGPHLNHGFACLLAGLLVTVVAVTAIYSGVRGFIGAGPQSINLQTSLDPLIRQIAGALGTDEVAVLDRVIDSIGLESLMQQFVVGLIGLINGFGIIAIYVAFLFADQAVFDTKMRALFPDEQRRKAVINFMVQIESKISSYLWIMTKISGLTAVLSYAVLLYLGVDHPTFWALLVFFLNFIPTIGSILGTILPVAFALVQFGELFTPALLCLLLGLVQFTMGNVVFPKMAGNALNLSLLVTILSLFVWGALWGVTGMFLAVPLTAVLVIILAHFETTRPAAIMLSKNGSVDP